MSTKQKRIPPMPALPVKGVPQQQQHVPGPKGIPAMPPLQPKAAATPPAPVQPAPAPAPPTPAPASPTTSKHGGTAIYPGGLAGQRVVPSPAPAPAPSPAPAPTPAPAPAPATPGGGKPPPITATPIPGPESQPRRPYYPPPVTGGATTTGEHRAEVILTLGTALIIANGITSKQFAGMGTLLVQASPALQQPASGQLRSNFIILGGELLFVVVLAIFSSASEDAYHLFVALILALWLVWSVNSSASLGPILSNLTKGQQAGTQPKQNPNVVTPPGNLVVPTHLTNRRVF